MRKEYNGDYVNRQYYANGNYPYVTGYEVDLRLEYDNYFYIQRYPESVTYVELYLHDSGGNGTCDLWYATSDENDVCLENWRNVLELASNGRLSTNRNTCVIDFNKEQFGNRIYFKTETDRNLCNKVKIDCDGPFDVGGNIASMYSSDMFIEELEGNFSYMFYQNKNIRHAERLILGTTLYLDCETFSNVDVFGPSHIGASCYYYMFYNSSLLSTPRGIGGIQFNGASSHECMFANCYNMYHGPLIFSGFRSRGFGARAFAYCFSGCQNMKLLPFNYSTYGTTSLGAADFGIPNVSYVGKIFEGCFRNCHRMEYLLYDTGLPRVIWVCGDDCTNNKVPAQMFYTMFSECHSLETAPELWIGVKSGGTWNTVTIESQVFREMFQNSKNLKNITYLCRTAPNTSTHVNWVAGVSPTGTFTKSGSGWSNSFSVSAIPSGWTVIG